jgi:hypothetical protein
VGERYIQPTNQGAPVQIEGWNVLDEDKLVLWREYTFRAGAYATTLVLRGVDGLVVVSPGTGMAARELDVLREHGEVRALIANNHYHHLGQSEWRAHFPQAVSYAPSGALAALAKKSSGFTYRPLSELVLPAHVSCEEPPGYRAGDAFLRIHTGRGTIWFTGDLLTNIQHTPGPPIRWLFTWTGSAPGFRLFKPGVWAFVRDRGSLRAWMLERLASDPPSAVVPAHGPAVEGEEVAARVREQLERL